jgi:deoxyribodipyrimidine photolyase-related protein
MTQGKLMSAARKEIPLPSPLRNLVVILGDQLNRDTSAFDGFDKQTDGVWMAEVPAEATHVWSHKARIVIFLSAMRHFRDELTDKQIPVEYQKLDDSQNQGNLSAELEAAIRRLEPKKLILTEPGEHRVLKAIQQTARKTKVDLEIRIDRHFLCDRDEFSQFAEERRQLRMEHFYRQMRKKTGVLLDNNMKPVGGNWNYDKENRDNFDADGPGKVKAPRSFQQDDTTRGVIETVDTHFASHPGNAANFDYPVTRKQARQALNDFLHHRLANFGRYQDAMWTDRPWLYHSRLSSALNLKLLHPQEVIEAAENAYHEGSAPLSAVEGFIRQIMGWREYVRGIYWRFMPDYLDMNALDASGPLPHFYWTGETHMNCIKQVVGQTLDYAYAHHIQRLMVTGLFALLLGVRPRQAHEWYLAAYADAVEWVELPNTLGMSQFADGGLMASKPYAATGKYIQRMSNYCKSCPYQPDQSGGEKACPFTILYWDFLLRNESKLKKNQRMQLQLKNLGRLDRNDARRIRKAGDKLKSEHGD